MATYGLGVFGWTNTIIGIAFALSAALQFNDPDPLGWVAVYGSAALACAGLGRLRLDWLIAALIGLVALIWAATLLPVLPELRPSDLFGSMKADTPSIELSRELLGLLVIFSWMVALIVASRRRSLPAG